MICSFCNYMNPRRAPPGILCYIDVVDEVYLTPARCYRGHATYMVIANETLKDRHMLQTRWAARTRVGTAWLSVPITLVRSKPTGLWNRLCDVRACVYVHNIIIYYIVAAERIINKTAGGIIDEIAPRVFRVNFPSLSRSYRSQNTTVRD